MEIHCLLYSVKLERKEYTYSNQAIQKNGLHEAIGVF